MNSYASDRRCSRELIPEIQGAARLLDAATSAHALGRRDPADELIRPADMPVLRDYTEWLWAAKSPRCAGQAVAGAPAQSLQAHGFKEWMLSMSERENLLQRDGIPCLCCGIPVKFKETRD